MRSPRHLPTKDELSARFLELTSLEVQKQPLHWLRSRETTGRERSCGLGFLQRWGILRHRLSLIRIRGADVAFAAHLGNAHKNRHDCLSGQALHLDCRFPAVISSRSIAALPKGSRGGGWMRFSVGTGVPGFSRRECSLDMNRSRAASRCAHDRTRLE